MKPKTIATRVIIASLVVSCLFVARSCRLSDKYQKMKLTYEGYKLVAEADFKMSMSHIKLLETDIAQKNEHILNLKNIVATNLTHISNLSRELTELQAAEPSQPELETQPLVINLRAQVSNLTKSLSLSQQTITAQSQEIALLVGKFDIQVEITDQWIRSYDQEHSLRLLSEGLVKKLENKVKSSSVLGRAKNIAIAVAGGYVAYTLLKKKG